MKRNIIKSGLDQNLAGKILACGIFISSFLSCMPAFAAIPSTAVDYLPNVTEAMTDYNYWVQGDPEADTVLNDKFSIGALNQAMLDTKDCSMYDLRKLPEPVRAGLPERLAKSALAEMQDYTNGKYFDRQGNPVSAEMTAAIADNCRNSAYDGEHAVQYGIAVHRTDLRAYPTEEIITDERGDINFDYVQLSSVRVNEPMVLRSVSKDGRYYYGYTNNCGGWVAAEDIAICIDRTEWLGAWDLPEERTLVVTDNRIYMEESNTDPEVSGLILTQGTLLELAVAPGLPELITNRSTQYNYVVFIPIRTAEGRYQKKAALISKHYAVSIGYVPLTRRNILKVAFEMLGDAYGWGGMLGAEDCSGYVRGIYRCFGLELPRNTSWQSKAPAHKYDLTGLSAEEKKAVLKTLPAGATLFFSGHEMMYLGTEGDNYYVISSVSTAANPFGPGLSKMRLRSVVINTLDVKRMNGRTWMDNLHTALIPYLGQ